MVGFLFFLPLLNLFHRLPVVVYYILIQLEIVDRHLVHLTSGLRTLLSVTRRRTVKLR